MDPPSISTGEENPESPDVEAVRALTSAILPGFTDRAVRAVANGECSRAEMAEALELAAEHGAQSWAYVARCLETVRARASSPVAARRPANVSKHEYLVRQLEEKIRRDRGRGDATGSTDD